MENLEQGKSTPEEIDTATETLYNLTTEEVSEGGMSPGNLEASLDCLLQLSELTAADDTARDDTESRKRHVDQIEVRIFWT